MNNQFSHIDQLVTRYVKGTLTGQALVDFQNQLKTDVSLQEKVALEQMLYDVFLDADALRLKEQMKADFKDNSFEKGTQKWWLGGLGASVLLIGGGILFFNQSSTSNTENLATEVLEQPTQVIVLDTIQAVVEVEEHTNREIHTLQPVHFEKHTEPAVEIVSVSKTEEEIEVDTIEKQAVQVKLKESIHVVEKTMPTQSVDPCENVAFKGEMKLKKAQKGNDNGEIAVDERWITGGKKPYLFSLSNSAFSMETQFSNLVANEKYGVFIQDDNGCVGLLNNGMVTMTSTECIADYQATFSVSYEQDWQVPLSGQTSATVQLVNRVGQTMLNKQVEEGENYRWDGIFENGNKVTPGRYNWIINYQDGEQCVVKMTVLN